MCAVGQNKKQYSPLKCVDLRSDDRRRRCSILLPELTTLRRRDSSDTIAKFWRFRRIPTLRQHRRQLPSCARSRKCLHPRNSCCNNSVAAAAVVAAERLRSFFDSEFDAAAVVAAVGGSFRRENWCCRWMERRCCSRTFHRPDFAEDFCNDADFPHSDGESEEEKRKD